MTDNVQKFKTDLKKFADQVGIDVGKVRRKVALDLFAKITARTPVDSGRLRASWAMSDGRPMVADPVGPDGKATGSEAQRLADSNITATFTDPFGTTFIATGLPYASVIEFDGHSKQSPAGMVRVSIAEVEAEMEAFSGPIT